MGEFQFRDSAHRMFQHLLVVAIPGQASNLNYSLRKARNTRNNWGGM